jgi:predicted dehydrogenase
VTASDTPPIRIGLVGLGFMGRQHAGFVRTAPGAELTAVADPALERASAHDALEAEPDCPRYADAVAMLNAETLDAVIIANPNGLHVDTAIVCLEAGVAVLVEKPVAVDYAESLRLVTAVARLSGRLLVGHHRRHHPAVARARDAIDSGELGDLVTVSGMWSAHKEDAYFTDTPWHRTPGAGAAHQRGARPRPAPSSVRRGVRRARGRQLSRAPLGGGRHARPTASSARAAPSRCRTSPCTRTVPR